MQILPTSAPVGTHLVVLLRQDGKDCIIVAIKEELGPIEPCMRSQRQHFS